VHYYRCLKGAIVRTSWNSITRRQGFGFSYFDIKKNYDV